MVQVLVGGLGKRLSVCGIDAVEFTVLSICSFSDGPIALRDMRDRLPIDPGQISHTVTQLEDKNLLRKTRLRNDQRLVNVYVTEEGRSLMPELMQRTQEYYGLLVRDIGLEELAGCMAVMAKMTTKGEKSGDAPQGGPTQDEPVEALISQLPGLVTNLVNLMFRGIEDRLSPHNVSVLEYSVLAACFGNEPVTVRGLLQHVPIDAGQMSRVVARLHDRGLVRRVRIRSDRRVVRVRMTDAGREMATELIRLTDEHYASVIQGVSGEELAGLMSFTEKMTANAESASYQTEDGLGRE